MSRIVKEGKKPRPTPPFPERRKLVREKSRIFSGDEDTPDLGHARSEWKNVASIGRGSSGSSSSNDNVPHVLTTSLAEGSSEDPSKESNASVSIVSRSRALHAIPETTVRAWVRATAMADRVVRKVGEGETRERVNADVAQDIDDGEVYDLKHLS